MYQEIHIWGDSLARGIVYNEEKARYAISRERCSTRLALEPDLKVENHATMGATVLEGLAAFTQYRDASPMPQTLCAVEFGGNDCDLDWKHVAEHPEEPVLPRVTLETFEQTLTTFVTEIRKRGMFPLLVTPLPLHAERYFQWVTRGLDAEAVLHALGDVYHIYRWQERYAIAVRNVARKQCCAVLDLRDVLLAQPDYASLMCMDGIHPNDAGHRLLADAVLKRTRAGRSMPQRQAALEAREAYATAVPTAAKVC